MQTLKHTELAVVLLNGSPALVYSGEGEERAILSALRPLMEELPRGQQIRRVILVNDPLPRTATGKIKRWELQQKVSMP